MLGELDKASEADDMDAVTALRPRLNAAYARLVHVKHVMDNGENQPVFGVPAERHEGSATFGVGSGLACRPCGLGKLIVVVDCDTMPGRPPGFAIIVCTVSQ